ncbi:hypothetical protein AcV5_002351 [Taiwanofungus camphoratus]|nr:hypothetical protein AcV5_002351 [Antrodia cinnamomea]
MNPQVFSLPGYSQAVHTRRMSAAKVPLSARSHIENLDAGLTSVQGAREVIAAIKSRRLVTKLILGHNELGDDGCQTLFGFLSTEQGRRYHISEISLNSNRIGDRGLQAISEYLRDNSTLRELFLQNNAFTGDPEVIAALTEALNSSCLETLSLTTNNRLSDAFIAQIFPALDAPYLRELQISVLGLTYLSAPYIIEYITSSRCRLNALKANGNRLGLRGARAIIRAMHRRNFTLTKLEMYANGLADADASSETTASDEDGTGRVGAALWQESEKELKRVLLRNEQLKRATEREALALLRYARTVLLRPRTQAHGSSSMALVPCSIESLFSSIGNPLLLPPPGPSAPTFPFSHLPTELQLHILSFLAPTLSSAQRIRIYTYAASPATLPQLLPSLSRLNCIPNLSRTDLGSASGMPGSEMGVGMVLGMTMRKRGIFRSGSASGRTDGKCMGAGYGVICKREEERSRWLTLMRCNAFELEEDDSWNEEDARVLLASP